MAHHSSPETSLRLARELNEADNIQRTQIMHRIALCALLVTILWALDHVRVLWQ